MEERITELELRYMQQERIIEELNEIICRQEVAIEAIKREMVTFKEQFMAISPSVSRDPDQEEPPPHY